MGKTAKFLKKVKKSTSKPTAVPNQPSKPTPQEQKKRAALKAKANRRTEGTEGHVLGGADYVSLMMGGRRKAKQEAAKLPREEA